LHRTGHQAHIANNSVWVRAGFFRARGEILADFPELFKRDSAPGTGSGWCERGSRNLGQFALLIHEVAGWDFDREQQLLNWPLRDLLQAAVEWRKAEAARAHHEAWMRWAALAPHAKNPGKPPAIPEILR
jgi:hypothetical protein